MKHITRRRCLQIIAANVVGGLHLAANPSQALGNEKGLQKVTWQGVVLGANAHITLFTQNGEQAKPLISSMLKEVQRLEGLFSLYQDQSTLSALNRTGELAHPPTEFHELVNTALSTAEQTQGAFDPTIQPLFLAYKTLAKSRVPGPWHEHKTVRDAKQLINWQNVKCTKSAISFAKPGMGLTLNGIAQGYITDKATHILKQAGFAHCLINFGEYHSLGPKPDQTDWNIQLGTSKDRPIWQLQNEALAASSRHGLIFDEHQNLHHLLTPQTGSTQPAWQEIYVKAHTATLADAASTALFAAPPSQARTIAQRLKVTKALLIKRNGTKLELDGPEQSS